MTDTLLDDEVAIYIAIWHTKLFRFDSGGCTFADTTATQFGFRGFADRWSAPFVGKARYICARQPDILTDFTQRNQLPARLTPQLVALYGHQLLSERDQRNPSDTSRYLVMSRVGFTSDKQLALGYIEYTASCGYYLLFERAPEQWKQLAFHLAWVS